MQGDSGPDGAPLPHPYLHAAVGCPASGPGSAGERTLARLSLSGCLSPPGQELGPPPRPRQPPLPEGPGESVPRGSSNLRAESGGGSGTKPGPLDTGSEVLVVWTAPGPCRWQALHTVETAQGSGATATSGRGSARRACWLPDLESPVLPRLWHCTLMGPSRRTAAPGVRSKFTSLPVAPSPPWQLHPPPGDRTAWPFPAGSPPRAGWGTSRAAMETLRVETVGSRDGQCGHRAQGLLPVDALPTPPEGQGQDPLCPRPRPCAHGWSLWLWAEARVQPQGARW